MFSIYEFEREWRLEKLKPISLVSNHTANKRDVSMEVADYLSWVADVNQLAVDALNIPQELLAKNRVRLVKKGANKGQQCSQEISVVSFQRGGAVVSYDVPIGRFVVNIKLLNLPLEGQTSTEQRFLSKGSFGEIVVESGECGEYVIKRIRFERLIHICRQRVHGIDWNARANLSELKSVLYEFAIAKICSVFGIGAPIITPFGFDVLCFRDRVEFCMEKCEPFQNLLANREHVEKRLKFCMRVMHLLKLIHKDIKPANILFSPSLNDYVLCDFGISQPVEEELGCRTTTYSEGTQIFMSPEMKALPTGEVGEVDLYRNDLYCLKTTFSHQDPPNRYKYLSRNSQREQPDSRSKESVNVLSKICCACYSIYCREVPSATPAHPYRDALKPFFPQLDSNGPIEMITSAYLRVQFVVPCVSRSNGLEYYLQMCDPNDERVKSLLPRVRSLNQKDFDKAMIFQSRVLQHRAQRTLERELHSLQQQDSSPEKLGRILLRLFHLVLMLDLYDYQQKRELLQQMVDLNIEHVGWKKELTACKWLLKLESGDEIAPQLYSYYVKREYLGWKQPTLQVFLVASWSTFPEVSMLLLRRAGQLIPADQPMFYIKIFSISKCFLQLAGRDRALQELRSIQTNLDCELEHDAWTKIEAIISRYTLYTDTDECQRRSEKLLKVAPRSCQDVILSMLGKCYTRQMRHEQAILCLQLANQIAVEREGHTEMHLFIMRNLADAYLTVNPSQTENITLSVMEKAKLLNDPGHFQLIGDITRLAHMAAVRGFMVAAKEHLRNAASLLWTKHCSIKSYCRVFEAAFSILCNEDYLCQDPLEKERIARETIAYVEPFIAVFRKHQQETLYQQLLWYNQVGSCYQLLGQLKTAYSLFQTAEGLFDMEVECPRPPYTWLYRKLAVCEVQFGHPQSALRRLEQMQTPVKGYRIQENDRLRYCNEFETQVEVIKVTYMLRCCRRSQAAAEKIIQLYPQVLPGDIKEQHLINTAANLVELGIWETAVRVLDLSQSISQIPLAQYYRARCLIHLRNRQEGIALATKLLDLSPVNRKLQAKCYNLLANTYRQAGEAKLSARHQAAYASILLQTVKASPTAVDSVRQLQLCLCQLQRTQQLVVCVHQLLATLTKEKRATLPLVVEYAVVLMIQRKYKVAARYLQMQLKAAPKLLYSLCKCYIGLNQNRKLIKQALKLRALEGGSGQFCDLLNKSMEKAGLLTESVLFTNQPTQENSEGARLQREVLRKRQRRTQLAESKLQTTKTAPSKSFAEY